MYTSKESKENKQTNNNFEKDFPSWWIMSFLEKLENVRKFRDIKLVTTERRRHFLVPKLNYHATKIFTENL